MQQTFTTETVVATPETAEAEMRRLLDAGIWWIVVMADADTTVRLVDVAGDSRGQDGDNFAIGLHLVDSVHDVRLERVSMSNALDTLHPYWNGDGFATEREVQRVELVATRASGNSDAGYDLKSSSTMLEDAVASGNKRNYRLWGREMVVVGCSGLDPASQGGTGEPMQVQLLEAE